MVFGRSGVGSGAKSVSADGGSPSDARNSEGLLDRTVVEGWFSMSKRAVPRRLFLTIGIGGAASTALASGLVAQAAPASAGTATTVTLWRLDPEWGYPLTTESGSDTKSRCRASACHKAAPHRYFLTAADATAGRLHRCCLAQPEPVQVCIDLNALMPYYRARLGGVDDRCADLPTAIRDALASGVCTSTTTAPTSVPASTTSPTSSMPATTVPTDVNGESRELAFTGGSTAPVALAATAAVVAGATIIAANRSEPDE